MTSNNSKYVTCHDWAPKQRNRNHEVSRTVCLMGDKDSCPRCLHRKFILKIPMGAGNQAVFCPRWGSEQDRAKSRLPAGYIPIRRETCVRARPFSFCSSCPNSDPSCLPRNIEGWYEGWREERSNE